MSGYTEINKLKILPTRLSCGFPRLVGALTIFAGRRFDGNEVTEDIRSRTTTTTAAAALTRICSDGIFNFLIVVVEKSFQIVFSFFSSS